jgi:tripartite-type tricarboxylate transporter receptor subunit TctC
MKGERTMPGLLRTIAAASALLAATAFGADFPSKPVKLIVTAGAGGGDGPE